MGGAEQFEVEFDLPVPVRLQSLLSRILGISRSQVARLQKEGALEVEPRGKDNRKITAPIRCRLRRAGGS